MICNVREILLRATVLLLVFSLFSSCSSSGKKEDSIDAELLFSQTASLLTNSIEKAKNSSDTIQLESILEEVDKKLTEINFSFPPETDFKLSEQHNDSIFKLMQRLQEMTTEKRNEFHRNYKISTDSLLQNL